MAAPMTHPHRPVAVADPVARFFALGDAAPQPEGPGPRTPPLRVIPGGREAALRQRRAPQVYRRRRILAGGAVVLVLALALLAARGAVALVAPSTSTPAAPTGPAVEASATPAPSDAAGVPPADVVVVQPGDTLWSIASELHPDGDVRPVVDELARRNGGAGVEIGARIDVRGLADG